MDVESRVKLAFLISKSCALVQDSASHHLLLPSTQLLSFVFPSPPSPPRSSSFVFYRSYSPPSHSSSVHRFHQASFPPHPGLSLIIKLPSLLFQVFPSSSESLIIQVTHHSSPSSIGKHLLYITRFCSTTSRTSLSFDPSYLLCPVRCPPVPLGPKSPHQDRSEDDSWHSLLKLEPPPLLSRPNRP